MEKEEEKKQIDPEEFVKSALLGVVKWFAWVILVLGLAVAVLLLLAKEADFSFKSKTFVFFATIVSVFAFAIYVSFQAEGQEKGRSNPNYLHNENLYREKAGKARREEVFDFLLYAKEVEKHEYIKGVCRLVGITEETFNKLKLSNLKRKDYSNAEWRHLTRALARKYPKSTYPETPAVVLNVVGKKQKGSHGVDVNAKKRYLRGKTIARAFTSIIFAAFSIGLIVVFGVDNWLDFFLKLLLVVASFLTSLCFGFLHGLKATSIIEKDILGGMVRLLEDMDIWLEAGKPSEPTDKGQGN